MTVYDRYPFSYRYRVTLEGREVFNWTEANDERGYVIIRMKPDKPLAEGARDHAVRRGKN